MGRGEAEVGPLVVYQIDRELDSPLADTPARSVVQRRFVSWPQYGCIESMYCTTMRATWSMDFLPHGIM